MIVLHISYLFNYYYRRSLKIFRILHFYCEDSALKDAVVKVNQLKANNLVELNISYLFKYLNDGLNFKFF